MTTRILLVEDEPLVAFELVRHLPRGRFRNCWMRSVPGEGGRYGSRRYLRYPLHRFGDRRFEEATSDQSSRIVQASSAGAVVLL
jgi:hypothetical protein